MTQEYTPEMRMDQARLLRSLGDHQMMREVYMGPDDSPRGFGNQAKKVLGRIATQYEGSVPWSVVEALLEYIYDGEHILCSEMVEEWRPT